MRRGRVLVAAASTACAALPLAATGSAHPLGGATVRVAVLYGSLTAVDPALVDAIGSIVLDPACGSLVSYLDKPLPAGYRVAPDLAQSLPSVSRDGRVYTFTIRKAARFSSGAPVTARSFTRALERVLNPAMQSGLVDA